VVLYVKLGLQLKGLLGGWGGRFGWCNGLFGPAGGRWKS